METLSTDGPGCDLARKKNLSGLASDIRDDKIPSFPSPSRGSITHSFTLNLPISISLGARCLSAVRAWVMRDFTPTHSDFRVRIQIPYSPQSSETRSQLRYSASAPQSLIPASRGEGESSAPHQLSSSPSSFLAHLKNQNLALRRYHSSTQNQPSLPLILPALLIQSFLLSELTDAVGTKVPARAVL